MTQHEDADRNSTLKYHLGSRRPKPTRLLSGLEQQCLDLFFLSSRQRRRMQTTPAWRRTVRFRALDKATHASRPRLARMWPQGPVATAAKPMVKVELHVYVLLDGSWRDDEGGAVSENREREQGANGSLSCRRLVPGAGEGEGSEAQDKVDNGRTERAGGAGARRVKQAPDGRDAKGGSEWAGGKGETVGGGSVSVESSALRGASAGGGGRRGHGRPAEERQWMGGRSIGPGELCVRPVPVSARPSIRCCAAPDRQASIEPGVTRPKLRAARVCLATRPDWPSGPCGWRAAAEAACSGEPSGARRGTRGTRASRARPMTPPRCPLILPGARPAAVVVPPAPRLLARPVLPFPPAQPAEAQVSRSLPGSPWMMRIR
ncbi:hypothetical protein CDD83_765 [Cordyceps sp. RAO-2017]|nr:hypothetical protein CDD83_765 [Cordyceps sp. RAO-2017]